MNIWLDTRLVLQSLQNGPDESNEECRNDCRDDCNDCGGGADCVVVPNESVDLTPLDPHSDVYQNIKACPTQQIESLYIQAYDNGRWLVCNPTLSGQIAVLDQQAMALLQQFRTPTTLAEVIQRASDWSMANIEKGVMLFHRLGFLRNIHHPLPTYKTDLPQTLSAWLHVTNACNLRCHYCYLHKSSEHMSNTIAQQSIHTIFRSAKRHHYQRVLLKYAGGRQAYNWQT